jgi:hypothetical protein
MKIAGCIEYPEVIKEDILELAKKKNHLPLT